MGSNKIFKLQIKSSSSLEQKSTKFQNLTCAFIELTGLNVPSHQPG